MQHATRHSHNHRLIHTIHRALLHAMWLCALLLAGCTNTPATSTSTPGASHYVVPSNTLPINAPVTTTGCGLAPSVTPGISVNVTIAAHPAEAIGHTTRMYRIHLPRRYNNMTPVAVVLAFHGFGGTAAGMEGSGFSTLADSQDFIAVYPQGLNEPGAGKPFWAEIGPIDFGDDDVLFVSNILDDLQKKFCVDAHRIYATGFSNGGGMTTLLACRFAGRIAAFAPISGNDYAIPGGCHPGRPVPLINMHGSADPLLPYNGSPSNQSPDWTLSSLPAYLHAWAVRDGCTQGPTIFLRQPGHPGVTGMRWTGCQGNVSVVHYRIDGGGHHWPPSIEGQPATEVLWHFFQQYTLP